MYTHLFGRVKPAFWLLARIQGWKEDKMLACPCAPPPPPSHKKGDAKILNTGIFADISFTERFTVGPLIVDKRPPFPVTVSL